MKSKKNEELNFLYLNNQNSEDTKNKKTASKKKKQKKSKKKAKEEHIDESFNFENEIVIGVTKIPKEKEKKITSKNNKKSRNKSVDNKKGADKKSAPKNKKNKKETKKKRIIKKILKWTSLVIVLLVALVFFMMSPLFNVTEITVLGNNGVSTETIISLSQIEIGSNIYKTSKEIIKKRIKENAYIESVEVKRRLPNKIELEVKERKTSYMLEYGGSFAYINNQGYILEVSNEKLDVPIIEGYTTNAEELQAGKRLNKEDLSRLEMILKITESKESNEILEKINRISIEDNQNYTLKMEEEKKTVYLGNASNLSSRMLYLKAVLEDTKGLTGEIFISGDLVKEKAFFRQAQ